ncbi:MAG: MarR family transcriptional regulator, partial [Chloroflexota bacterium]|nr:MarR family transcriptional regulator [Chloroflexota bacterium]
MPSATFMAEWQRFRNAAQPWTSIEDAEAEQDAAAAWAECAALAQSPNILELMANVLEGRGVAGERRNIQLLYLIVTSRVLPRPISASVKGPSSSGKSYTTEQVLTLFPESAYYPLSGMSERALVYDDEPLQHRYLVIYEAAGLTGDFASYLVRSLLSEGKIRYITVEKTSEGIRPKTIERDGPTGLLVTTTAVHLHPENETRMLSIPATDSRDQTARIMLSIANPAKDAFDPTVWHALQRWIDHADHEVAIPYATQLATMIPPIAVRLRRDFGLMLSLIKSHAILHQATRDRDEVGQIIASMGDYAVVHGLVEDLVSSGIEASVPATVRETVDTVKVLLGVQPNQSLIGRVRDEAGTKTVSITEIAKALKLDKSATSRRVKVAIDGGYLRNDEQKRGRPAKIAMGEPLPEDQELLPSPARLAECC